MSPSTLRRATALAAVLTLAAAGSASAGQRSGDQPYDDAPSSGRVLFATTDQNQLIRFNSNRPDRLKDVRSITGLSSPTTSLVGVDFRPATGDLYGLGSDSVVYRINPRTGIAVSEGPAVTPAPAGRFFGVRLQPDRRQDPCHLRRRHKPAPERRRGHAAGQRPRAEPGHAARRRLRVRELVVHRDQADGHGAVRDRLGERHAVDPEPDDQRADARPAPAVQRPGPGRLRHRRL